MSPPQANRSSFSVRGRRVVVVGLGASGRSAVSLLLRHGADVVATDRAPLAKLNPVVRKLGCTIVAGGHEEVDFLGADLIVVSPGVPSFDQLEAAEKAGVEVIGETELASRFIQAPIAAVGGTNGKSTVTTLLGHLLDAAELRLFVGGNLGEPSCEAADQETDAVVLEVSSFQMERLVHFRPKVAALVNISEDHLDRYPSFEAYAQAKGNCFERQRSTDYAIYPAGNELCREQVSRGRARLITFGPGGDYFSDGKTVVERSSGRRYDLSTSDLHGRHNLDNAAAAIAMARSLGVSSDAVNEGLRRFRALPHRMALSGRFEGVTFYDDSKATNVGAAVTALRGLTEEKGVLIAGGRDKLGAYDELVVALKEKARAVVVMGEAAERLKRAIGKTVPVEEARTMQGAVVRAYRMAQRGDAVLLSPACSSLDMFKNYSDRGERFSEAVESLSSLLESNHP